ncbi:restriction endonuclease subunit S [Psychrobacter sp.]|uniref:restriction endonuclease subunit S n=1 Tax=Psychrobacter sp. TaxID=56811 RepID=UPI00356193D5
MVNDWEEVTLGDTLTLQRGFDLSKANRVEGHIPIVASNGIVDWHDEFKVKAPGVVIGRSGSIGGGQYIEEDFWPLNTTLWVKDFKGNNERFCYYLLLNIDFQMFNVGSGVPTLNRNHIHPLPISLPPVTEQKAIAHTLGSLDDKIELNRQMNETLEAMAQALFKSWFVDFDPVIDNALAAGNAIPDEFSERAEQRKIIEKKDYSDIQGLFPDEFQFTEEMGWVPKGWESGTLGDFAILGNGKTSPDRAVGEIPVFGSNGKIGDCDDSNRDNTVIIGRVGSYCGSLQYYPSKCWITDNAMSAEMENKEHNIYLFQLLSRDNLNDRRTGSGQPLLNQSILRSIKTILPSVLVIDEYSRIANSLYEKIYKANGNNEALAKLRDTLLPKLMSGELRIPDAETLVDEAL